MTKTEAFTRDEAKRNQLARVLPVVVEALEALKDQIETGKLNEGVVNPVIGNSYFQQLMGARYLIQNLPGLTELKQERAAPEGRRQYTEEDRGMLQSQQEDSQA